MILIKLFLFYVFWVIKYVFLCLFTFLCAFFLHRYFVPNPAMLCVFMCKWLIHRITIVYCARHTSTTARYVGVPQHKTTCIDLHWMYMEVHNRYTPAYTHRMQSNVISKHAIIASYNQNINHRSSLIGIWFFSLSLFVRGRPKIDSIKRYATK